MLDHWALVSTMIMVGTLVTIMIDFGNRHATTKQVALIVALGTLTAVLRIPFAFIPNVQPCTFLIICAGVVFGPSVGFMIGALVPLISNLFLGHGPWTPLQMYAWGLIGALSGIFNFGKNVNRWVLAVFGLLAGYLYGFIMNIWFWYSFMYPVTLSTFIVAEAQGLYFDTLHAIGNLAFVMLLGKRTLALFSSAKE
jgi:energy-coupling factor transport system substrate-specific component